MTKADRNKSVDDDDDDDDDDTCRLVWVETANALIPNPERAGEEYDSATRR